MEAESLRSQAVDGRKSRGSGRSVAYRSSRSRPVRVLPLVIAAVVGTLSVAAAASQVSREISHGRYAEDIIKRAL